MVGYDVTFGAEPALGDTVRAHRHFRAGRAVERRLTDRERRGVRERSLRGVHLGGRGQRWGRRGETLELAGDIFAKERGGRYTIDHIECSGRAVFLGQELQGQGVELAAGEHESV